MFQHEQCYGCEACASICQYGAITMKIGDSGFYGPELNPKLCVECGACESICPLQNCEMNNRMQWAYLFVNANQYERNLSSSGGFFKCAANFVLENGGIIYGAAFADDFSVEHVRCEEKDILFPLLGSKYVQSRIGDTFVQAARDLEQGRTVLFSGTSCQIAGLKNYLGRDYENLYTIDLICHGTPSPGAWKSYLEDYHGDETIRYIDFRYKVNGWWEWGLRLQYAHEEYFAKTRGTQDPYMRAFLQGISLNEPCYSCKFRSGKRVSDFYIGDAWNINRIRGHMDDNRGITTVIINSDKGHSLFEQLKKGNICFQITLEEATAFREDLFAAKEIPFQRKEFLQNLVEHGFKYAYEKSKIGE